MAIGTILAVTSIATSLGGAGLSFSQAARERKRAKDAEEAAEKFVEQAYDTTETNYYDKLSIKKTPYEMERDFLLATSADSSEAAAESERGASAAAGRLAAVSNNQMRSTTSRMTADQQRLEQLQTREDARLSDERRRIMIGQAEGAGVAENEAMNNSMEAIGAGAQQVGGALTYAATLPDLYGKNGMGYVDPVDASKPASANLGKMSGVSEPVFSPGDLRGTPAIDPAQNTSNDVDPQVRAKTDKMHQMRGQLSGVYPPGELANMSYEDLLILTGQY